MKIYFVSVIEQNAGYGAEVFLNRGFQKLGHETITLDYRKHREQLAQRFFEAPGFDAFLLQRGDYFPIDLVRACRRPRFFYSSELVSRRGDQWHLFQSNLFHRVFVRTESCRGEIVRRGWMPAERVAVLLSAFDEETHRPLPDIEPQYDVVFVGSATPRRRAILDRLKQSFRVLETQAFGHDMAAAFNRGRVAVNLHAEDRLDTETRVFEALGSGSFLISEPLTAENPFKDGEHLVIASSMDDLEAKIRHYLEREDERRRIAGAGRREALAKHSYLARAREIIEAMAPWVARPELTSGPPLARPGAAPQPSISKPSKDEAPRGQSVMIETQPGGMNVGIVTTWFERGAALVSRQYRDVLAARHNVFIYARGGESAAVGDPRWDDGRVTWAKPAASDIPTVFDLNHFRRWLTDNKIQAVLFNEQHWWPPVAGCCQMGIKTGAYVDYYTELTIPLFACYDFLLCNTRRHHSAFEWHPRALHIPWGTDLELFKPRTEGPVEPGACVFFHSAGFNPMRKGADLAVRAFAGVRGNARMVVHAQRPLAQQCPDIAPLIQQLTAAGRLEIIEGTVPAPGLYHRGDVYVYPSRLDGLGLTMAEALACGLPLIVSDQPPMTEFADGPHGARARITRLWARSDGYYWPQCLADADHLREIMQSFADAPEALPAKKRAARAYAEKRLNWSENAKELPALLESLKIIPLQSKQPALRQAQLYEQRRGALRARG